ncbi:MAG TPA: hypothetical protein VFZ78_01375, partial [Flavisolibacter sp.]
MKRWSAFIAAVFFAAVCSAQQSAGPEISLKWSPASLLTGNISLHGEYNFGKNSLTAKIGLPTAARHTFAYDGSDVRFVMKATTFMAGYRTYLSKKHMRGLYLEPFFKYVHHS